MSKSSVVFEPQNLGLNQIQCINHNEFMKSLFKIILDRLLRGITV